MINVKFHSLRKSIIYAVNGFVFCVRYERNMRIHIVITLYVLFFSRFYELSRSEIILLIMLCANVISFEMVNTAIEVTMDKFSPDYHFFTKVAKDVAAGAVLIAVISAALAGFVIFGDPAVFVEIFSFFTRKLSRVFLLALSLLLSLIFIFSGKSKKKFNIK